MARSQGGRALAQGSGRHMVAQRQGMGWRPRSHAAASANPTGERSRPRLPFLAWNPALGARFPDTQHTVRQDSQGDNNQTAEHRAGRQPQKKTPPTCKTRTAQDSNKHRACISPKQLMVSTFAGGTLSSAAAVAKNAPMNRTQTAQTAAELFDQTWAAVSTAMENPPLVP
ncbi:hypothetical protein GGTG_07052 [Gaeumannomyces tritici R3-111a-1]|uniref:Uncharacterized protein n=1 Tax=Gaeumannomyces tritici (strain R3-111a-1) TaxID=644352 RepID=J3P0K7_GAET3|nr:hypothetical protein GGTG_07052 [Gaeumannomyces tritici R3-111a-1]EJT77140.1 hypothetical protein GGTG_07052 [Gaeumannomyces tritici R3-111a-1]